MGTVNRSIVIVKPKKAYVDWANSFTEGGSVYDIEFFRRDCNVYLVNEVEEIGDDFQEVQVNYAAIFERELESWNSDKELWPVKRDYEIFETWFEVEIHSVVYDLGRKEIEIEEG